MRATAVQGGRPHTRCTAQFDHEQGRAGSLHPEGTGSIMACCFVAVGITVALIVSDITWLNFWMLPTKPATCRESDIYEDVAASASATRLSAHTFATSSVME
jgi:hypothetical protein